MREVFRGVRPVAAPPELRERTLAAARAAATEPAVERTSLWGFGRFDLALAATLLLLVLVHLVVVGGPKPSWPQAPPNQAADEQRLAAEVGPVVVATIERDPRPVGPEQVRQIERLLVEIERL